MHVVTRPWIRWTKAYRPARALLLLVAVLAGVLPSASAQPADDLAPLVIVTDPGQAQSLDWRAIREEAGTNYPNRWDDLTLLDPCLWLTAEEIEAGLGLSIPLMASKQDVRCIFSLDTQNFIPPVFYIHLEVHADTTFIRDTQRQKTEGFQRLQFTPFDLGTPDLKVYVQNDGDYLYVYPTDGQSMWRLEWMDARRFDRYDLPIDYTEIEDFGVRYLQLIVEKFGDQL